MNIANTLRGLLRRWYITFPGIILAVAVAFGAWVIVPPTYERTATELLLPGAQNMPADSNPLLFLGGLSFAADVLVRAVGAESVLDDIKKDHPNVTVDVQRDGSSGGPFLLITVTAPTDAEAGQVMDGFIGRTSAVLESLQVSQGIEQANRITVVPVAVDQKGTLQPRNRLVASAGAGVAVLALTLLLAGLVDGLSRRRRLDAAEPAAESDVADEPRAARRRGERDLDSGFREEDLELDGDADLSRGPARGSGRNDRIRMRSSRVRRR